MKTILILFLLFMFSGVAADTDYPPNPHRVAPVRKSALDTAIEKYTQLKTKKAYALAIDGAGVWAGGYGYGYSTQAQADARAMKECDQSRVKHNIVSLCKIYMRENTLQ